jgi:hypothetical protein
MADNSGQSQGFFVGGEQLIIDPLVVLIFEIGLGGPQTDRFAPGKLSGKPVASVPLTLQDPGPFRGFKGNAVDAGETGRHKAYIESHWIHHRNTVQGYCNSLKLPLYLINTSCKKCAQRDDFHYLNCIQTVMWKCSPDGIFKMRKIFPKSSHLVR